jgi:hypothetical protein
MDVAGRVRGSGSRSLRRMASSKAKNMNWKKSFPASLGVLLVLGALALPAAAIGQDQLANPSASQYEPQQGVEGTSTTGGSSSSVAPAAASTPSSGGGDGGQLGSLPFTGMDLLIVAGVALVLTGTGLALHRLSLSPRTRD